MDTLNKLLKEELEKSKKNFYSIEKKLQDSRIRKSEAASFGDLRENSAHSEAEQEIGMFSWESVQVDTKIKEIEELINMEYKSSGYIGIKSCFECIRLDTNEKLKFFVVTDLLGNALNGLLPVNSALGKAVQGKKAGDTCVVTTSLKSYVVEIIKVI